MKNHKQTCIIDDDAIAVFGLKRALAAVGFTTELTTFENGLDALENFGQRIEDGTELPSLLFIDLNMPIMDGWDFMEEFTKSLPNDTVLPEIFIMTSSIDVRDLERAETFGLEGNYLVKPVSSEVLEGLLF